MQFTIASLLEDSIVALLAIDRTEDKDNVEFN